MLPPALWSGQTVEFIFGTDVASTPVRLRNEPVGSRLKRCTLLASQKSIVFCPARLYGAAEFFVEGAERRE
jgi:hypothetical protein